MAALLIASQKLASPAIVVGLFLFVVLLLLHMPWLAPIVESKSATYFKKVPLCCSLCCSLYNHVGFICWLKARNGYLCSFSWSKVLNVVNY